ncbi:hypothetical protein SAY86_018126 [Trapa natans]|uniref:Uncharacterized protein n=1 Tax=Trapa natans TaxID=22666 RepID=A0AAN7LIL3_TRANT|nr:hypothetical protein SAY86_018126 [Trapa natans]
MLDPDAEDVVSTGDRPPTSNGSSSDSVSVDHPHLWVHENSGLLHPVFRFLGIEKAAWSGIEESAGSSLVKHHVGDSLSLLAEDNGENTAERSDQQLALSKAIENMILSIEKNSIASKSKKEKHQEYENECREKLAMDDAQLSSEAVSTIPETSTTSETST